MRKGAVLAAGLLVTVAGCGGKTTDSDRAADQVRQFVEAAASDDGASVCAALTRSSQRSVKRLAAAQGQPGLACSGLVVRQLRLAGLPQDVGGLKVKRTDPTHFVVSSGGLAQDPATGVRVTNERGIYRITLADVAGVKKVLKAGRRCAAARRSVLSLPLPPPHAGAWPAYLDRAARRARRAAAIGVDGAGPLRATARRLQHVANRLRGGAAPKTVQSAVKLLAQLDRRAAKLTVPQADCGANPRIGAQALQYIDRVDAPCAASRVAARRTAVLRGDKARLALRLQIKAQDVLVSAADGGPLPKVLDTVRDGFVADLRKELRVARGQAAALRAHDLRAYYAAAARLGDRTALAGRVQLALDRLGVAC